MLRVTPTTPSKNTAIPSASASRAALTINAGPKAFLPVVSSAIAILRLACAAIAGLCLLGPGAVLATEGTPGAPDGWWASTQRAIAAAEYEASWSGQTPFDDLGGAYQAPNRAQGLRSYFASDGLRIVPRDQQTPGWQWKLSLVGYGRGSTSTGVAPGAVWVQGNRVECRRGEIVEWFVNDESGLEQGFDLPGPPEKTAGPPRPGRRLPAVADGLVHLELALGGDLRPTIAADGQSVDFFASTGGGAQALDRPGAGVRVLRLSHLLVTDAAGAVLPAHFAGYAGGGERGLRIVIDDHGAAYPLHVDPLATSPAWTAEANQTSAYFGGSVATAGDVNGDGYSDVIVGAYAYDVGGSPNAGRAFVFHGGPSGLSATANWTWDGSASYDSVGRSVSTAGDVNGDGYSDVIVGADGMENGQTDEGRAFVFFGSSSGLSTSPDWSGEPDQASASYGFAVSAAGDVNGDGYSDILVGARYYDGAQTDEGGAFLYFGSGAGPSAAADWTASNGQAYSYLGSKVAMAGDVNGDGYADILVSEPWFDNGQGNEGRASLFLGSASGPSTAPDWTRESDQANARFPSAIGTAGDVNGDGYADVVLGDKEYDTTVTDGGRVEVFYGSPSGLSTTPDWSRNGSQTGQLFGAAVGTAGDVDGDGYADVAMGSPMWDQGLADQGRVEVFYGAVSGLGTSFQWTQSGDQTSSRYGDAVATAGDVNGDGYSDLIVGAWQYDNGETNEGQAYVYLGSADGVSKETSVRGSRGERLGWSVHGAGDVNGDGYADVIVGAFGYDNGETNEGRALLYLGSAQGLSTTESWSVEGQQAGAEMGNAVGSAGDVNGDGFDEVIVGAHLFDNGQANEGQARVYLGSPTGPGATADWTAEPDSAYTNFGETVAGAGDVNGDGYADVAVGGPGFDGVASNAGAIWVYLGGSSGLSPNPSVRIDSSVAGANLGGCVDRAGDVNGDGYGDLIAGAEYAGTGGEAYLYVGGPAGLDPTPAWSAGTDQASSYFGRAVAGAGDLNGDGYGDLAVGADAYGSPSRGRVQVFYGHSSGPSTTADWTYDGAQDYERLGAAVAGVGDVNGDGYADLAVGVPDYDRTGTTNHGLVLFFFGSASGLGGVDQSWADGHGYSAADGHAVAGAGDIDGDGYADVVVGGPDYYSDSSGWFVVLHGGGGNGVSLGPRQMRADASAAIGRDGASRQPGEFRLDALGRSPFGRGTVKMQFEIKPRDQRFDGTPTRVVGWTDSGVGGASLSELFSGLDPGTYHWRVRTLYDPATLPFQPASRWFTQPWSGWEESDISLRAFIGGKVWEDRDRDGIRQSDEPLLGSIAVDLLDAAGTVIDSTVTDSAGSYRFEADLSSIVSVRFSRPSGWRFTLRDRGADDGLDSDADPSTGETAQTGPPFRPEDETLWSAGIVREGPCFTPDQKVYIASVRQDANSNTVLDIQDPNQPDAVTGYDIYRSSDAGLPRSSWPLVASNVVDSDAGTPNVQWTDLTGDVSPTGAWYYDAAAYNAGCDAEGPR